MLHCSFLFALGGSPRNALFNMWDPDKTQTLSLFPRSALLVGLWRTSWHVFSADSSCLIAFSGWTAVLRKLLPVQWGWHCDWPRSAGPSRCQIYKDTLEKKQFPCPVWTLLYNLYYIPALEGPNVPRWKLIFQLGDSYQRIRMYLLIICGQWVRLKIYSKLIASIIRQNFLFGYLPNVDTSLNGHLLSAARYGTYLCRYVFGRVPRVFYDIFHRAPDRGWCAKICVHTESVFSLRRRKNQKYIFT